MHMIHNFGVKNEEIPNMTIIFENFQFVGVFPTFSDKNIKNAYDT